MSNNKQSSIDWLLNELVNIQLQHFRGEINLTTQIRSKSEAVQQAKSQHKKETIDFALHCMMPNINPDKSTIEVVSDIYDEFFGGNNDKEQNS